MPLKSSGRNGNHHTSGLEAKTNGHGDEESSNSDCDSSLCKSRYLRLVGFQGFVCNGGACR